MSVLYYFCAPRLGVVFSHGGASVLSDEAFAVGIHNSPLDSEQDRLSID